MNPYPSVIITDIAGKVPTVPSGQYKKLLDGEIENGWLYVNTTDKKIYTRAGTVIVDLTAIGVFDLAAAIHNSPSSTFLNPGDELVFWDYYTQQTGKINVWDILMMAIFFFDMMYFPLGGEILSLDTYETDVSKVLTPNGMGGLMWTSMGIADTTKSVNIKFSDINVGVSPDTEQFVVIDPLLPNEYITNIYINVLTNFLASDASIDLDCDFYDVTNGVTLIPNIINLSLDVYSLAGNVADYYPGAPLTQPRDLAQTITLALRFFAADLTLLVDGELTVYYVVKQLV